MIWYEMSNVWATVSTFVHLPRMYVHGSFSWKTDWTSYHEPHLYHIWVILHQAGKFAKRHKNMSLYSFVLLLYPSLTSKFLSYALAAHDIQYNRFYSQLKCTMFENIVNCVTANQPRFFIYRVFLHWLLCKIRKWGMSLTLVQYSLCSFWQMFVMVITFTYSSHAPL